MIFTAMVRSKKRTKLDWKSAIGAADKPKRLHLVRNEDDIILCPVPYCEHYGFLTERGCRKHVSEKHGWWYFFDTKPIEEECFPQDENVVMQAYERGKRIRTTNMPTFKDDCSFGNEFGRWLESDSGGSKSSIQSNQIKRRVLKYLKSCFPDADACWDIPKSVVEYCIACTKMLTDFLSLLKDKWNLGYSGMVGYLQAISDAIEFCVFSGGFKEGKDIVNIMEIFVNRTRKALTKKMRLEWNKIFDIDYLEKQGCWATYENLQLVVPFHEEKYWSIIERARDGGNWIQPIDLSFCTHFVISMLFLSVKASRPMTYQFLTVDMVQSIKGNCGTIDQTMFKTMEQYGFDSLIFEESHLKVIRHYINFVRPRLHPVCEFVFVTRTGRQLSKLSSILGNMVYEAVGKYIHPTRLRQVIETESALHLSPEQQAAVSEDQKHSSHVARVHYKKLRSRDVAFKAKEALSGLSGRLSSTSSTKLINELTEQNTPNITTQPRIKCEEEQTGRAKKTAFSKEEDGQLKEGIRKHGWGNWTAILRDRNYKFYTSRVAATLQRRAKQKKFNVN